MAVTMGCPACSREMDTRTARWCQCVGKAVSPTCEHCGVCLCKASDSVRADFWRNAPASLTDSRDAEQRRRTAGTTGSIADQVDVLIVDDDEEIRMLAAYSIQQMGYRVAVVSSGQDALTVIDQSVPRIVLTDALMPNMDGRQLCRLIKAAQPDVKVIIMTSLYTAPRYKSEAYKQFRADGYLPKPIDFKELQTIMNKLAPAKPEVQS